MKSPAPNALLLFLTFLLFATPAFAGEMDAAFEVEFDTGPVKILPLGSEGQPLHSQGFITGILEQGKTNSIQQIKVSATGGGVIPDSLASNVALLLKRTSPPIYQAETFRHTLQSGDQITTYKHWIDTPLLLPDMADEIEDFEDRKEAYIQILWDIANFATFPGVSEKIDWGQKIQQELGEAGYQASTPEAAVKLMMEDIDANGGVLSLPTASAFANGCAATLSASLKVAKDTPSKWIAGGNALGPIVAVMDIFVQQNILDKERKRQQVFGMLYQYAMAEQHRNVLDDVILGTRGIDPALYQAWFEVRNVFYDYSINSTLLTAITHDVRISQGVDILAIVSGVTGTYAAYNGMAKLATVAGNAGLILYAVGETALAYRALSRLEDRQMQNMLSINLWDNLYINGLIPRLPKARLGKFLDYSWTASCQRILDIIMIRDMYHQKSFLEDGIGGGFATSLGHFIGTLWGEDEALAGIEVWRIAALDDLARVLPAKNIVDDIDALTLIVQETTTPPAGGDGSITCMFPVSSSTFEPGDSFNVVFSATGTTGPFRIQLVGNDTDTLSSAASYSNTGTYPVVIPNYITPNSGYKIHITALDNTGADAWSVPFTLEADSSSPAPVPTGDAPVVTRSSPSSETVSLGRGWRSSFKARAQDANEDIKKVEWIKTGGIKFYGKEESVTSISRYANDSQKDTYYDTCIIEVTESDTTATLTAKYTDDGGNSRATSWTIVEGQAYINPYLNVLSPKGGEAWRKGTTHAVKWSSEIIDPDDRVSIELLKGGSLIHMIENSKQTIDFTMDWTVPESLPDGSDYTVRITRRSDSRYSDISDYEFTVTSENAPPMCEGKALRVAKKETGTISLDAFDPNADPLTFSIGQAATLGTASVINSALGEIRYVAGSQSGMDSFNVNVTDGTDSIVVTVNVMVAGDEKPDFALFKTLNVSSRVEAATYHEGYYYVGCSSDKLYKYDEEGTLIYETDAGGGILDIAVSDGYIVAGLNTNEIARFRDSDGTRLGVHDCPDNVNAVAIHDGKIYAGGDVDTVNEAFLRVFSLASGSSLGLFPSADESGRVHEKDITDIAIYGNYLYTASEDKDVRSWNLSDGYHHDRFAFSNDVNSISIEEGLIAVGMDKRDLRIVTTSDQSRWSSSLPSSDIEATVIRSGEVFATGDDGHVWIWKLVPPSGSEELVQDIVSSTTTIEALAVGQDTLLAADWNGVVRFYKRTWNTPPMPTAQDIATHENTNGYSSVASNDPDDGDEHTYAFATQPKYGTASVDTTGYVTYTPCNGYIGSDSFSVSVTDTAGDSGIVTINVDVSKAAPVAVLKITSSAESVGELVTLDGSGSYSPDGSEVTLSWTLTGPAVSSTALSTVSDGTRSMFIPDTKGIYVVELAATANNITARQSTIVTVGNSQPVAMPVSANVANSDDVIGSITYTDSDTSDTHTFRVISSPQNGTLTVNPDGSFTYTPNDGFRGRDRAIVALYDSNGGATATSLTFMVQSPAHEKSVFIAPVINLLLFN